MPTSNGDDGVDEKSILLSRHHPAPNGPTQPVRVEPHKPHDDDTAASPPQKRRWDRRSTGLLLLLIAASVGVAVVLVVNRNRPTADDIPVAPPQLRQIAFVGNSMFYFNDFPRFFQVFASSGGTYDIHQNSCLQGGGSIPSLWLEGNAMYPQFETDRAIIHMATYEEDGVNASYSTTNPIYDYGACTVPQLLTGTDDRLNDPGYAVPSDTNTTNFNPCRVDPNYLKYTEATYPQSTPSTWDFVLINDNTRNPSRFKTRAHSLQFLESFYAPLLRQTKAVPVLLWTHAYSTDAAVNMTGLEDVANFTSLTLVGYREYANLLQQLLPESQAPRIAPVGMAFLTVHEENRDVWRTLFHSDHLHASPSGSFLQALCVYHTLFGEMPDKSSVVRWDMSSLWNSARMMQHAWEPTNPFPTRRRAEYLYDVAERVLVYGHVPSSFINYQNGEVAAGWD